jgi:multiple sugar transport system substrate-binding protein
MSSDRPSFMSSMKSVTCGLALAVACAALMIPSTSAESADLVVWWEKGFYPQADEAVAEVVSAFEQESGKKVELIQPAQNEVFDKARAALDAGQPPDFLFGADVSWERWAYDDQLAELEATLGSVLDLFDVDAVESAMLLNGRTGRRGLYGLPMGRRSNHLHVWNGLLERAGLTLADVPKQWEAFWSFWCDQVQPAVRKALGRDDIWGVGLPMSAGARDTENELEQFQLAYEAPWLDRDRRLQVDDSRVRAGMVKALEAYTRIWRKGCTPPDAASWTAADNNKAFLAQRVVMTANATLSIPAALRSERPDDYYENAATIDWPDGANGQPLIIDGSLALAVVFKVGRNPALAVDFVRFLAEEGWLAHWLDFAGDQWMPPMRKLVEQPFWLDTSDPHRMRAAVQMLTRAHQYNGLGVRDNEVRSTRILEENIWGTAVHRVVAEGITPEQAIDEAIARIKQILSE